MMKSQQKKGDSWLRPKPKCVILAGGMGSRLLPLSLDRQKSLIEVNGRPILQYVIEYWQQFSDEFIFLVRYKKEGVIDFVNSLGLKATFIEVKELKGIADAISYVKDLVDDKFIVVLSDCICVGNFSFPERMVQGVGVISTKNKEDIFRSYSIEHDNGRINKVVEKPKQANNDLCGMGFYFFDKRVFDYVKKTPPSALRNEIEITDAIQKMIDGGEEVSAVFFKGDYLNITYPDDLKKAGEILMTWKK